MRTETKWAIIASITLFVILLVEKILGLQTAEKIGTWIMVDMILAVLLFVIIYYAVTKEKRDADLNGTMTWAQGFWAAAVMTLIFIPLSSLLVYIFLKMVNPDAAPLLIEHAGKPSGKDPVNSYLYIHLLNAVFLGLLFSLIFPLFTRRSAA
jgi:hypothetical protein